MSADDVKAIEAALACFPAERVAGYDEARCDLAHCCTPERMRRLLDERAQMVEALQWYAAMSKRMGNAAISQDSQAMLTLMKDVAVDYGGRARAALARAEGGE